MKASLRIAALCLAAATLAGCALSVSPEVTIGGHKIEPYVADTPAERDDGLQGFDGLAAGEGMVFVYPDAEVRTFGIKDVAFPIDVVFIGPDLKVSGIVPLSPGDDTRIKSPGPAPFAVELPHGWAAEKGIGVGSEFVYEESR